MSAPLQRNCLRCLSHSTGNGCKSRANPAVGPPSKIRSTMSGVSRVRAQNSTSLRPRTIRSAVDAAGRKLQRARAKLRSLENALADRLKRQATRRALVGASR
jgi:hypothetical protein